MTQSRATPQTIAESVIPLRHTPIATQGPPRCVSKLPALSQPRRRGIAKRLSKENLLVLQTSTRRASLTSATTSRTSSLSNTSSTTITTTHASFATFNPRVDGPQYKPACPVHSYETPASTLTRGALAFSTDRRRRDSFTGVGRTLAPVHAYHTPRTSLSSEGGTISSAAARASTFTTPTATQSGLTFATRTPLTPANRPKPLVRSSPTPPLVKKTQPKLCPRPMLEEATSGARPLLATTHERLRRVAALSGSFYFM